MQGEFGAEGSFRGSGSKGIPVDGLGSPRPLFCVEGSDRERRSSHARSIPAARPSMCSATLHRSVIPSIAVDSAYPQAAYATPAC